MAQDTTMTQTTFENTYNQFTPKVFNNPIIGKLTVLKDTNNNLWFIGSEVAKGLGYEKPERAIQQHVPDNQKMMYRIPPQNGGELRGNPNKMIISEQGLYALISQSQLDNPQIEEFKKWMFKTIKDMREYGISVSDQFTNEIRKCNNVEELQNMVLKKQAALNDAKPALDYYHEMVESDKTFIPISRIADNYGMTPQELNARLYALGFHHPVGDGWVINEKYKDEGLVRTRKSKAKNREGEFEFITGYSEQGRRRIHDILYQEGVQSMDDIDRRIQYINDMVQMRQQQPQTINYNYNYNFYGSFNPQQPPQPPAPGQPGYKPTPVTHIGPDGREYTDGTNQLVVMTDRDGYPLGMRR